MTDGDQHTMLRMSAFYYARGYVPFEEYRAFRRALVNALVNGNTPPEMPADWTQEPQPNYSLAAEQQTGRFHKLPILRQPKVLALVAAATLLLAFVIISFISGS